MHGTQQKATASAPEVTLHVRPDRARGKMSDEIARDRVFLGRLENTLVEAKLPGVYHLDAYTMVKGSPHRQGFHVGLPRPNRNCIELIWQPRGNDECYSIALMVPRTHDLFEFHKKLDQASLAIDAREETESASKKQKCETASAPPLWNPPSLPSGEEVLRAIIKSATSTGVVSASACIDLLEATYKCTDPKQFLITMIGDGYFVNHNGSETFLRITQDWLDLLQGDHSSGVSHEATIPAKPAATVIVAATSAEPAEEAVSAAPPVLTVVGASAPDPKPAPIEHAQLASAPVVAALVPAQAAVTTVEVSPENFVRQLTQWKRIAAQAAQNRARSLELQSTIDAGKAAIEAEQRKVDEASAEQATLARALSDPEVLAAEKALQEIGAAFEQ